MLYDAMVTFYVKGNDHNLLATGFSTRCQLKKSSSTWSIKVEVPEKWRRLLSAAM